MVGHSSEIRLCYTLQVRPFTLAIVLWLLCLNIFSKIIVQNYFNILNILSFWKMGFLKGYTLTVIYTRHGVSGKAMQYHLSVVDITLLLLHKFSVWVKFVRSFSRSNPIAVRRNGNNWIFFG